MVKDVKTKKQVKKERTKPRRANGDKLLYMIFSFAISTAIFFGLIFLFNLFERGSVDIFYFINPEFYLLLVFILVIMFISDILGNLLSYGLVYLLYVCVSKEGMIKSFWDLNEGKDTPIEKFLTNLLTRVLSSIMLITGALWAISQQFLPEVTIPLLILVYIVLKIIIKALAIIIVKSLT